MTDVLHKLDNRIQDGAHLINRMKTGHWTRLPKSLNSRFPLHMLIVYAASQEVRRPLCQFDFKRWNYII